MSVDHSSGAPPVRSAPRRVALMAGVLAASLAAQPPPAAPPDVLPGAAARRLAESLAAAAAHASHVWRDTPPWVSADVVNAYVEITRGDRRKWEFDMRANARAIDRTIPAAIGGYPVNYGFVPQTISYDGDPFDVLVLGPPIDGGTVVRGRIVGLMFMDDEKGHDAKVVVSPLDPAGHVRHPLTPADRAVIGRYFADYKRGGPGTFSFVPGWGSAEQGRAYVDTTHAFFKSCRESAGACQAAR
jgi:inorganic pyrophosphatase